MDLLDSILNSMQKPPTASEAQKNAIKKQKEAMERKQKEEKEMINKFRKRCEEKITEFIKDDSLPSIQFEPMEQMHRSIIRDVAETAGIQVFTFGQENIGRYIVVYKKDQGPSEDELTVRRSGEVWNEQKAVQMVQQREMEKQAATEEFEAARKRKRRPEELSGTFYKDKYAHLIGQDAAIKAAHKTNVNKSYGEVPSANKKDQRSIEQTMADIRAKKIKKAETEKQNTDTDNT